MTQSNESLGRIERELQYGMKLVKCQKCGCMKDTLEHLRASLTPDREQNSIALLKNIEQWSKQMESIKYGCLGCNYCYPTVAMNIFSEASLNGKPLPCMSSDEHTKDKASFPIAGEYFAFWNGTTCPIAVSTLSSVKLAEDLVKNRPKELCIVGKTETENISVEKVIKNIISNSTIKFLILAGKDSVGHYSGNTMLALWRNGVDKNMKVIGSRGKLPVLKNMTMEEVNRFRKQR